MVGPIIRSGSTGTELIDASAQVIDEPGVSGFVILGRAASITDEEVLIVT